MMDKNNHYYPIFLLTILALSTPTLHKILINKNKVKGIYNAQGTKLQNKSLNFSKGSWYTFKQKTKDGRIMEFHPEVESFLKYKTMGVVSSMGYYKPMDRVIAFYPDKKPLPKVTITKTNGYEKGESFAAKKIEAYKKNHRYKDILSFVNYVPTFTMYDFMTTNPFPFHNYWHKVYKRLSDEYLEAPYKHGYEPSKDQLRSFYRKVAKYFALITLFNTELDDDEPGIEKFYESEKIFKDNVFIEDWHRPMNSHTYNNIANPLHLRENFKLATKYMVMVAKHFLVKTVFYSSMALKKAGAFSANNLTELIQGNLNYSKSYLFSGFTFYYFVQKYDFGELTGHREVTIYEQIFDTLVEVYNEGFYSYDLFVKYRGKKNGGERRRWKLTSKNSKEVVIRVFRFFCQEIYPHVVAEVVGTFLSTLKETSMFQEAGLEGVLGGDASKFGVFRKYMKMMGYMGFSDKDLGMLSFQSTTIFSETLNL